MWKTLRLRTCSSIIWIGFVHSTVLWRYSSLLSRASSTSKWFSLLALISFPQHTRIPIARTSSLKKSLWAVPLLLWRFLPHKVVFPFLILPRDFYWIKFQSQAVNTQGKGSSDKIGRTVTRIKTRVPGFKNYWSKGKTLTGKRHSLPASFLSSTWCLLPKSFSNPAIFHRHFLLFIIQMEGRTRRRDRKGRKVLREGDVSESLKPNVCFIFCSFPRDLPSACWGTSLIPF